MNKKGDYLKLDIDLMVTFLIIWGIPTFMVVREYLKMGKEDRKGAIDDFKTPGFIFTIVFVVVGAFLANLGNMLTVHIIKLVGIVLLAIGGIVLCVDTWRKNKLKGTLILLLISVSIFFLY